MNMAFRNGHFVSSGIGNILRNISVLAAEAAERGGGGKGRGVGRGDREKKVKEEKNSEHQSE